jgi:hypothetical protein
MTRPLWQDLAEAADTLALAGKVDKPTLQLLRASAVQMENWFIGNSELREELAEASQRIGQQDQALQALADTLQHAARFARLEVTMDEFGEAVRDKAPFANIMAHYGRGSVGEPAKAKRRKAVA